MSDQNIWFVEFDEVLEANRERVTRSRKIYIDPHSVKQVRSSDSTSGKICSLVFDQESKWVTITGRAADVAAQLGAAKQAQRLLE